MDLSHKPKNGDETGREGLDLQVLVSCPQCGGGNEWGSTDVVNRCRFCASVLYWPEELRKETLLVAQDRLATEEDIRRALAFSEAMMERAEIIGRMIAGVEQSQRDAARLRAEESAPPVHDLMLKIMPGIGIKSSLEFHAPYRVLQVVLVFHALGRDHDRKRYRPLFFILEDVLPAYGKEFNFRDRGLWFSKTVLKPLTPEKLAAGRFIVPGKKETDKNEVLKHYLRRTELLKPDMEPISFEGGTVTWKEWTVFRPFHLVFARTPREESWFLLDGQFGTIAGRPDSLEADFLSSGQWPRVAAEVVKPPEIKVIPFRCPTCGSDVTLDASALYQLCRECGRLLSPGPEGLETVPYRTLEISDIPWRKAANSVGTAWLPFWAFPVSWETGGEKGNDVLQLGPRLIGTRRGSVPEEPAGGRLLYVPAFDGWTCDQYDDWSFEAAMALSSTGKEPFDARLIVQAGVGKMDSVVPAAVEKATASALFPKVIPAFFSPEAQARLNPLSLGQMARTSFSMGEPVLVYVPFPCLNGNAGETIMAGPRSSVGLSLLKERKWPPVLVRTVRRRLEMAKRNV